MKPTEICGRIDDTSDIEEVLDALHVLAKVSIIQELPKGGRVFGLINGFTVDPDTRQLVVKFNLPDTSKRHSSSRSRILPK